jgi:hypothetical protein
LAAKAQAAMTNKMLKTAEPTMVPETEKQLRQTEQAFRKIKNNAEKGVIFSSISLNHQHLPSSPNFSIKYQHLCSSPNLLQYVKHQHLANLINFFNKASAFTYIVHQINDHSGPFDRACIRHEARPTSCN